MKKKLLVIIIAIIVLLIGAVVAYLIWGVNREEPYDIASQNNDKYIACIKSTSCEQLATIAAEHDIILTGPDENLIAISGAKIDDKEMDITFDYNEDSIKMVRWDYDICAVQDKDITNAETLESLKYDVSCIVYFLGTVLEEDVSTVLLYSPDGSSLDAEDLSNYGKLLTGEAIFDLMICDREGMLWNARTHLSEDGVLSVHFYRSLMKEFNETRIPDIILE